MVGSMNLGTLVVGAREHLHIAVQPVTAAVVARYGGLRAEQLQARMLASGDEPDPAEVERFCDEARAQFQTIVSAGAGPSASDDKCRNFTENGVNFRK